MTTLKHAWDLLCDIWDLIAHDVVVTPLVVGALTYLMMTLR